MLMMQSLCIRRERNTLSHRLDARDGPVMGEQFLPSRSDILINTDHFSEKLTKANVGLRRSEACRWALA